MKEVFFSPPVLFTCFFLILVLSSGWLSKFAAGGASGEHAMDNYACGQRDVEHYVNPDYSQFFQYAFVFTVVHVLILVVATAPSGAGILPVVYIVTGILALLIIFRR